MNFSTKITSLEELLPLREMYRLEMSCQIIHESIHSRPGWTKEFLLLADGISVGYGSLAVSGPWKEKPTVYEFYVVPDYRLHIFQLFRTLLAGCAPVKIEVQSNDLLSTLMLHTFAKSVKSEKIIFEDKETTNYSPPGAEFLIADQAAFPETPKDKLKWFGVVNVEGKVAGKGGILFHYNPPYGDIFMEVAAPYRKKGIGTFLVQELKRICREEEKTPTARCNPDNIPSQRTLQKAGFVPCAHLLYGSIGGTKT